jgi:molybdopterin synthase catalytic subunit
MDKKAGGTAVFIGSVREDGQMGKIVGIRYESYLEMAEDRMLRIEKSVLNKYKILRVKMIHRIGDLSVGEISVVVAVSAPHRAEAFRACRYVIERIKKEVPIWKKEKLDGGIGIWVRK